MPAHLDDHSQSEGDGEAKQPDLEARQKRLEQDARRDKYLEAGVVTRQDIDCNQEVDKSAKMAAGHNLPPPEVIAFAKDRNKITRAYRTSSMRSGLHTPNGFTQTVATKTQPSPSKMTMKIESSKEPKSKMITLMKTMTPLKSTTTATATPAPHMPALPSILTKRITTTVKSNSTTPIMRGKPTATLTTNNSPKKPSPT